MTARGHPADPTRDVARLLHSLIPDLRITSLAFLGAGDFCHAYLLNDQHVVRLPRHDTAAHALAREACLLPRIASSLPLRVPTPHCISRRDEPCVVALHHVIIGEPLTHERWLQRPEMQRIALARQLGTFLRRLHVTAVSIPNACDIHTLDHHALAERSLQHLNHMAGVLPNELRGALAQCLANYRTDAAEWSYAPALLHGDISPEHVLIDSDAAVINGVLDWGDVAIGDPARDFIYTYEDWGSDFLRAALDGYGNATPAFLTRVYYHYIVEQLDWTHAADQAGNSEDVAHGVATLSAAVRAITGGDS